jgi:hypothetical protein
MAPISYRRHRFPPVVIQHAVWLYLRFTLSYRDVEELLAERGLDLSYESLDLSYESVRSWVLKFGPAIARGLRRGRPRPSDRRHLDEMVVRIAGKQMYLWRAVDHEGEVLEILVQRRSILPSEPDRPWPPGPPIRGPAGHVGALRTLFAVARVRGRGRSTPRDLLQGRTAGAARRHSRRTYGAGRAAYRTRRGDRCEIPTARSGFLAARRRGSATTRRAVPARR